ncbi:SMP-30/gluconolactonase/LRE family protein [Caballeronia sp. PC1]|uniref:SMP-30/gluconolactonase/LRE family protein n=1 Tax=unclassified Caballeronia TaxID=2646786 RepID=UPI0035C79BD6
MRHKTCATWFDARLRVTPSPASPALASSNRIQPRRQRARTLRIEPIAPQGSYLNDVRISPDGRFVYITDSGVRGAIVVLDTGSGSARRVSDGDPSTQADKTVTVKVDGKPLQQTGGRRVSFSADGIALTPDGRYLYWQAVKGKTPYRITTDALQNAQLSPQQVSARVEAVGIDGPADGLWFDERGRLYVSSVEHHGIHVRDGERIDTLLRNHALMWPDTFSEGADGTIYITDSRIPQMSWRSARASARRARRAIAPARPDRLTQRLPCLSATTDCTHTPMILRRDFVAARIAPDIPFGIGIRTQIAGRAELRNGDGRILRSVSVC